MFSADFPWGRVPLGALATWGWQGYYFWTVPNELAQSESRAMIKFRQCGQAS